MSKRQGIYVEIFTHVPIGRLWDYTQVPAMHQQWDFGRFTAAYPTDNRALPLHIAPKREEKRD